MFQKQKKKEIIAIVIIIKYETKNVWRGYIWVQMGPDKNPGPDGIQVVGGYIWVQKGPDKNPGPDGTQVGGGYIWVQMGPDKNPGPDEHRSEGVIYGSRW